MPEVPQAFVKQTREVLTHFYDYAYLLKHPLVQRVQEVHGEEGMRAVHELRRMAVGILGRLKPPPDIPLTDPAWRPHRALYQRYVLGRGLSQTSGEMGLGERQIQREQRKGIEALATMLWEALPPPEEASEGEEALLREIGRSGFENEVFDASEQVKEALLAFRPLARNREAALRGVGSGVPVPMPGNPSLFRQLVITATSFLLKLEPVQALTVCLERGTAGGHLSLVTNMEPAATLDEMGLPDSLLTLADAEGVEVTLERARGGFRLRLDLPAPPGKATVAIVEDNEDLLALFSRYLTRRGHPVVEVTDSATAQERLVAVAPDVIVLDIMMPHVDGWELLRQFRAEPRLQHVPVIVCSMLDEPELADTLGAARYLRKPVRPPELFRAISGVLEG